MRVYTPAPLTTQHLFWGFAFRFAPGESAGSVFKEHMPENFFERDIEYVESEDNAEAIIVPNNFTRLDDEAGEYLKKWADAGEHLGIPVYTFSCGDLSDALVFDPRITVFKYSIYRSAMKANEVSAPTLTEDIGHAGVVQREKEAVPTVSFCGKAGFGSMREYVATYIKAFRHQLHSLVDKMARARIRGVLWRIWSIRACRRSSLVRTLFIIRKTFSGALRTIELSPEKARADFIRSMRESDFVLASKGDGNYSNRFLEALSMGRIPVVVDTDIALPFEDTVDYSKYMVRIPMSAVRDTPRLIRKWYESLNAQEWAARQKSARELFEQRLRQDAFFRAYFASRHTQK